MKLLIIGGTGIISTAVSKTMVDMGHDVWIINRGSQNHLLPKEAHVIISDINDTAAVETALSNHHFDCVVDFIVQQPEHIHRDYHLFHKRTKQYIFISSSSVYQRPLSHYEITEGTPLCNPYWEYPRNKIACEETLLAYYRDTGFPITIIRPGHTYDEYHVPLCLTGYYGFYSVIARMRQEKPIIIPGDGTSLWTLTHSSDFARAFLGLAGNPHALGESVNVCSDEVMTWNQIYETIAAALGVVLHPFYVSTMFLHQAGPYDCRSPLLGERVQTAVFKTDKLKRLAPGFYAQTAFRTGIAQTLETILADPKLQTADPVFDAFCDSLIDSLTETASRLKAAYPNCV